MPDKPAPYRRTLLLDATGDLQFDGSGKLIMTATNVEKQNQDILIFMRTVVGEDMFAPGMGFDLIAAKEQPFSRARVEYEVRSVIDQYRARALRPNRIKEITRITVSDPDVDRRVRIDIEMVSDTDDIHVLEVNI